MVAVRGRPGSRGSRRPIARALARASATVVPAATDRLKLSASTSAKPRRSRVLRTKSSRSGGLPQPIFVAPPTMHPPRPSLLARTSTSPSCRSSAGRTSMGVGTPEIWVPGPTATRPLPTTASNRPARAATSGGACLGTLLVSHADANHRGRSRQYLARVAEPERIDSPFDVALRPQVGVIENHAHRSKFFDADAVLPAHRPAEVGAYLQHLHGGGLHPLPI